jgi:hypothetical protein
VSNGEEVGKKYALSGEGLEICLEELVLVVLSVADGGRRGIRTVSCGASVVGVLEPDRHEAVESLATNVASRTQGLSCSGGFGDSSGGSRGVLSLSGGGRDEAKSRHDERGSGEMHCGGGEV